MNQLRLFTVWPIGANGDIVTVLGYTEEEVMTWLANGYGEDLWFENVKDWNEITIISHPVQHGVICCDLDQRGVPVFFVLGDKEWVRVPTFDDVARPVIDSSG